MDEAVVGQKYTLERVVKTNLRFCSEIVGNN